MSSDVPSDDFFTGDTVTVYILVWVNFPDGTQEGPFTQSFEVLTGTDIGDVDQLAADTADAFIEGRRGTSPKLTLALLGGEGEAFATWQITSPLMYQYSTGD